MEPDLKFWSSISFHKGYLPFKDYVTALKYVVLASKPEPLVVNEKDSTRCRGAAVSCPSSLKLSATPSQGLQTNAHDAAMPPLPPVDGRFNGISSTEAYGADNTNDVANSHPPTQNESFSSAQSNADVHFFMFLKKDVTPPPPKFTITPKKVSACFFMCERENCKCDRLHVSPRAWRVQLDTYATTPISVSERGYNRRLLPDEVIPTAGYYFARGLTSLGIVQAVVPVMCRFNTSCRNGCRCLYIHADVPPRTATAQTASLPLREWVSSVSPVVAENPELHSFFNFLDCEDIRTVGDMQVLGMAAFESLANRIPPKWAELFLMASVMRSLDVKASLAETLSTFPRIHLTTGLPDNLQRVDQLLQMPLAEFYLCALPPHVMDACEIIRTRFECDEEYKVITIAKVPADSFFAKVTRIVEAFRGHHTHCSWRKHDPGRPIVTSVMTYVDVRQCRCHVGEAALRLDSGTHLDLKEPVVSELPPLSPEQWIGWPHGSWCSCPRRWEIAVNYELSTPSGSRCSEQNVMGKLASMGVPTWSVREVFVHGTNHSKEVNPLFPCGVCENMLQKVTRDVMTQYGGDVTLYMFDSTVPRKIVYLPISEISHRDGSSFKRFVAQDLRVN